MEGLRQSIYTISTPSAVVADTWIASIQGDGNFHYEAAVDNASVQASLNTGSDINPTAKTEIAVTYPEPIAITLRLLGELPVVGADVTAKVTFPDGSIVSIVLQDDGNAPDEVAGNGIYSGMVTDYDQDGIYTIEATASNLNGRAMFDSSVSEGTFPGDGISSEPIPAPRFHYIEVSQVNVMGTYLRAMQTTTSAPTLITTPDGTLYIGAIEEAGQQNWYQFNAVVGTQYYIQTSNLAARGMEAMATELTLYEMDGTSVIDSNVYYEGTGVSNIEWQATASGPHLISVGHAIPEGTGVYALSVSRENLLSSFSVENSPFIGAPIAIAAIGGGGGAVSFSWLLFLILMAVVALLTRYFFSSNSRKRNSKLA